MRRTSIRRRSKTNSRKHENLPLREQYRESNAHCEMTKRLKMFGVDQHDHSVEVHHVVGGAGRRVDVLSNLITVSRSCHAWLHAHPTDGRILCLHQKMLKGELDAEEFRRVSGMTLAGWLELHQPQSDTASRAHAALVAEYGA